MPNKFPTILLAEMSSFSQKGIEAFGMLGYLDVADVLQATLSEQIRGYDVLVIRLGLRVNHEVLKSADRLRVIVTPTTGLDHIDLIEAERRNITALSSIGERSFLDTVFATSEHTLALMLSLLRHIPASFDAVKQNRWRRDLFRGTELRDRRVGILGYGRLGRMVAGYVLAFGASVATYDPYVENVPKPIHRFDTLAELLMWSQVLSIHVPLNEETRDMIGAAELSQLPAGAMLVNTSRGAIVNETALIDALESGHVATAAVDVLSAEESIAEHFEHPMIAYARAHDNLIITPHIGGATVESIEKADLFMARKLEAWLAKNRA